MSDKIRHVKHWVQPQIWKRKEKRKGRNLVRSEVWVWRERETWKAVRLPQAVFSEVAPSWALLGTAGSTCDWGGRDSQVPKPEVAVTPQRLSLVS